MAGKTKINGISYTIKGGKCKVNGTSYSIGGGCTKVDGVAKRITFSRLPSGFQECEYIQSSGNQWIDTGLSALSNTKTVFDAEFTQTGSNVNWAMFGIIKQYWQAIAMRIFGSYKITGLGGVGSEISAIITLNTVYNYTFNANSNREWWLNSSVIGSMASPMESGLNYFLFAVNDNGNANWKSNGLRMYNCAMYSNYSSLVRNFVPCYSTTTVTGYKGSTAVSCASGTIGMYDLVGNRFYINSGSGTFSKGADV